MATNGLLNMQQILGGIQQQYPVNPPTPPPPPPSPTANPRDPRKQKWADMLYLLGGALKGNDMSQDMVMLQQGQQLRTARDNAAKLEKDLIAQGFDASFARSVSQSPGATTAYTTAMINKQLGTTNLPDAIEKYNFAVKQGYKGTFMQFTQDTKSPSTVIDQRGETEFVKNSVTSGFADIKETRAIVATSNELLPRLEAASLIIQSEDFDTGPTADAFLDVKKLYEDVTGVDVENITNQEVFKALANFTVPRMRPPGSGATSDFEANLFSTATFGLQNTKEGNEIIIGTMMQNAKRDKELLKLKEQYISLSKGEEGKTSIKGSTLGFDAWLSDNDLVPPLYKQINLNSENIGELYDNKQIRNGEVYIDMSDPRNPQLRVFRLIDFDD